MSYSTFIGGISESFRENWTAHTVRPDQTETDAFDIFTWYQEIPRLDWRVRPSPGRDSFRADWGAWACRVTKAELEAYNRKAEERYRIPESILARMRDGVDYAMIDVEDIGSGLD